MENRDEARQKAARLAEINEKQDKTYLDRLRAPNTDASKNDAAGSQEPTPEPAGAKRQDLGFATTTARV